MRLPLKIAQAGPSVGTSVKRLLQEIQDTKSSPLCNDDSDITTLKALVDKIELNYPNQETTDAAPNKVVTDSQLISPTHAGNHNRADPKLESPLDTKSKPGVDNLSPTPKTIDTLTMEISVLEENEKTKKIATSRMEAEASKTDSKVNGMSEHSESQNGMKVGTTEKGNESTERMIFLVYFHPLNKKYMIA